MSFKPYYKWNTFNTEGYGDNLPINIGVLNLIINGIPSILLHKHLQISFHQSFKPYYKWNTFNTLDLYKDIDFVVS